MRRTLTTSLALISSLFAIFAASAAAEVPQCTGTYSQKTLFTGQNRLESVIVGGGGTLYTSGTDGDEAGQSILNAYTPNVSSPELIASGPSGPGGLAWNGKKLLWGYGNTAQGGVTGDANPVAGLNSVSVGTGKKTLVSDHLGMANGIARAKDGTIFASNDLGEKMDRISPKGVTTNGWTSLGSANGLSVGKNGKYLYAAQTFETPSTIAKIDVDDPSKIYTFFKSPEPTNVIFDGLTRDSDNNLYVAVLGLGQVWKISPRKEVCVLASGMSQTSSVAISSAKKGFKAGNLYVVDFTGTITQVKGATSAGFPG
ncbi:MAG: SMP-30/gluconolactonase/LRE family protein [Solirubrobacterales bacterium]